MAFLSFGDCVGLVDGAGQCHDERAATPGLAPQLDPTAMQLGQRARDRQPEAGARRTAGLVRVETVEALEHQALIALTDARSVVPDFEPHGMVRGAVDEQPDSPADPTVL